MKIEFKTDKEQVVKNYSIGMIFDCNGQKYPNGSSISKYTKELILTIEKANTSDKVAKVSVKNVKKDNHRTCDNPVDHYLIKSMEPLNKLDLSLTNEGLIDEVLNRDEIIKRWGFTKIYLDRCFVSEDEKVTWILNNWTSEFEKIMIDDNKFLKRVKRDLIYHCLFCGYWRDYGKDNLITDVQSFPGLFDDAKLMLTNQLRVYSPKEDLTYVYVNGTLNKEESDLVSISRYLEIEENEVRDLTVELEGLYVFDNIGLIKSIELYVIAKLKKIGFCKQLGLVVNS